jgi:hypothetical protein
MSCHTQLRCQLRLDLTGLDALYFLEDARQPHMPQEFVSLWQAGSPKLVGSPKRWVTWYSFGQVSILPCIRGGFLSLSVHLLPACIHRVCALAI